MTRHERQAQSAGRALARALLAIENYDGDPDDIIEEARIALSGNGKMMFRNRIPGREGAGLALDALEKFFNQDFSLT